MEPVEPNRHEKAADAVHDGRPVEERFVRSGGKGKSVIPILVISTLAAAAVLFAIFFFSAGPLDNVESTGAQPSIEENVIPEGATPPPTQD